MHLAAENGHATIIELLADKFRASIFERTKDGSTLMHIASLNGHADCAMMLFKKGVYLHMPNKVRDDTLFSFVVPHRIHSIRFDSREELAVFIQRLVTVTSVSSIPYYRKVKRLTSLLM
jgi:ankyrin repeat protein